MISIIMPAFNAEKTIKQSLESILQQSYTDWELVIIDDCSVDRTAKIIEEFIEENKDCDIKFLRNDVNRGVAFSRNRGIKEASGEWIAFLDSDDLWMMDKLEKQIRLLNTDNAKSGIEAEVKKGENAFVNSMGRKEQRDINTFLVFTGSSFISNEGISLQYILHVPEKINRKQLLKQNLISCSSVLVSKSLAVKYPFPAEVKTIHEDFAVWIKMLGEIDYAYGIDEPLLIYRISEGSKSSSKSKAAIMNWNTYRYVGMGVISSLFYMIHYSLRGISKWTHIRINNSIF